MINYTEKGAGLHQAIVNAGHALRQLNGVWVSSNDAAVQSIIDNYTLVNAQTDTINKVNDLTKIKFDKVIYGISAGEMAGWSVLRSEAIAYGKSTLETDCPTIVTEALARGVTVPVLVAKINTNNTKYNNLRSSIAGQSGKHRDAIGGLLTFAAVSSYDYTTGWPL